MFRAFALQTAAAVASAVVMTVALLGGFETVAVPSWAGEDAPAGAQPQALETRVTAPGEAPAASA
jgi:hypothetical protein